MTGVLRPVLARILSKDRKKTANLLYLPAHIEKTQFYKCSLRHKINSARRVLQQNSLKKIQKNMEEKKLNFFWVVGRTKPLTCTVRHQIFIEYRTKGK